MKILYLITKSEIGGAQMHVLELMKYMIKEGHQVALMSYPGGWLEAEAKNIGVKFFSNSNFSNSYNPLNALMAILKIKKNIQSFEPDLVHCHSSGAGFLGRMAVRGRVPTLFTAHSWAFTEGAPFMRKVIAIIAEKFVSRYASKIICVSEFDRSLAIKYGIIQENKLVQIYNTFPLIETNNQKENQKINILSIGRFAYPKRFDILIDSIAILPKDIIGNIKLNIVGFGLQEKKIENLVKKLKLDNNVFIIGKKSPEELRDILIKSDIFILISNHEGLPITILEAMSVGLPVIASRVGGIPEEIDSSCGILVKNDKEEIQNAILELIRDKNTRLLMGANAYKKVREKFSRENFLEKTVNIYKEVTK